MDAVNVVLSNSDCYVTCIKLYKVRRLLVGLHKQN